MLNVQDFVLYYEYTGIFDLEGIPQMESSFGKKEVNIKKGEFLDLPFHEDKKSYIEDIEIINDLLVVTLNIPCKPLWENDGEVVKIKLGEELKYYYGRTTLNTQTDYYFKFKILNKN